MLTASSPAAGKTSPRLLQDLLTYDARYEARAGRNLLTSAPPQHDPAKPPVAAVPHRNCRHSLFTKPEQSRLPRVDAPPDHATLYKVASYCSLCHWHFDLVVDFRNAPTPITPCRNGDDNYALHHFLFDHDDDAPAADALGSHHSPRTYRFRCSAPPCRLHVHITIKPPQLSEHDVETLTNQAKLRLRLEKARQLAGDRADPDMARSIDALDYLDTYLRDCLNPSIGKARIPLLNRKFLKTFGKDCDLILERLGFTKSLEEEGDGSKAEVWYPPRPEVAEDPMEMTLRNVIEDTRYQLNTLILNYPDTERAKCRHIPTYPTPSRADMERALACDDCMCTLHPRSSDH